MIGFALSGPTPSPESLSQPLSLDLDFFVQSGDQQLRLPIMPLHLLGKKSWNVYNQDNIERVRRDEAAAKAREEAEEQQMQELDAERRMQILRGEVPTPLPIEDKKDDEEEPRERRSHKDGRERKKRKRAGENDTDFEMRVAAQESQISENDRQIVLRKSIDAPLIDHAGHIDLFPQERPQKPSVEKNAEAEREKERKKKEYEDQYTMRFSNAAGFKQGLDNPWYSKATPEVKAVDEDNPGKDVWGNEDPRRKEREAARIVSNDPLAAMKLGAAQARQVKKEREQWRKEKEREVKELEAEERSKKRRRRSDGDDLEDDLEGFDLDRPQKKSRSSRRDDSDHTQDIDIVGDQSVMREIETADIVTGIIIETSVSLPNTTI
ncbi:hypothetical protein ACMFMG_000609 [Clarireedia jacksonii]